MYKQWQDFAHFMITQWRTHRIRSITCLTLLINLLFLTPAVWAAGGGSLSITNAYALGLLLIVTLALSVYLLLVMFQPERF